MRRSALGAPLVALLTLWASLAVVTAQPQALSAPPSSSLSCGEMEAYLRTAKIVGRRKDLPVGVTVPSRVTLDDGRFRHDAAVQNVDVKKTTFETTMGTELNFRDAWQFNVAGYELAKLLELNMVPPYVERNVAGYLSSVSWWIDDAMMERDRFRKKIQPPQPEQWNQQMYAARIFHELVGDTDPNMTNMLITRDWRVWMIDFSRAFRLTRTLQKPASLRRIDRKLLAGLRGLTEDGLQQAVGRWLNKPEIQGVLARRDRIVQFFDEEVASKGEAGVLYDFERTSEPCGTGLH
jgi:hypothetical protein